MFGFMKKKKSNNESLNLVAVANGKVLPLSDVPDPIFAEKMAGDGVAIEVESNLIVAPASGEISMIFRTNHGFALALENGVELLVHIGVETVSLNGEGFKRLVEIGDKVEVGTPIIEIDRELIKEKGCSLITPVIITTVDILTDIKVNENINADAGETVIVEYSL